MFKVTYGTNGRTDFNPTLSNSQVNQGKIPESTGQSEYPEQRKEDSGADKPAEEDQVLPHIQQSHPLKMIAGTHHLRADWHFLTESLPESGGGGLGYLVDDVDAVSELLALQEGVQVVEQQVQVVLPGPVRHDDGRAGAGLTPRGAVAAPRFHPGVPLRNLCQ